METQEVCSGPDPAATGFFCAQATTYIFALDTIRRAQYREIETQEVCPGGKPRRVFLLPDVPARGVRRSSFPHGRLIRLLNITHPQAAFGPIAFPPA
jgi:hypothetical protein